MAAPVRLVRETIPDGDPGTFAVLERMRELATVRAVSPLVRTTAIDAIDGERPRDTVGQIRALRDWLERRVRYLDDPDTSELLHDPEIVLETIARDGVARIDCDDAAMLGAALGKSIGRPARFVVIAFSGPDAPFEHVWAELADDDGEWHELDITRPADVARLPRATRRLVVDLTTGERTMMQGSGMRRPYRPPQMGVALVAAAEAGASLVRVLAPFLHGGREPDRIKQNELAYREALGGNPVALAFLKQRTGDYGTVSLPGFGNVGGWATSSAKADARDKWQRAVQQLGQQPPGGTTVITTPGGTPLRIGNQGLILAGLVAAGFLLAPRLRRRA